jgi:hypothetical protein
MEAINPPDRIDHQSPQERKESFAKSWIVVFCIALFFFLWGLFIFYTVGTGRPPAWRYGIMPDVPGQSVYSVQGAEERAGTAFLKGKTIRKQHIMGGWEETGKSQGKKGR